MADQQQTEDYSGKVRIEFDLQFGIEHKDKILKHVVMRRVRNSDILAIQADINLQELAKPKFTLDNLNPVANQNLNATSIALYSLLFARTIERIDDIRPDLPMIHSLYPKDYDLVFENYTKLNEIDVRGALQDSPFFGEIMKALMANMQPTG